MGNTVITAAPGSQSIKVERSFAAPPELVFRAYVDPALLGRWMGGVQRTMTIETWELRHGGRWRFIHGERDGSEYAFRGVFHGEPSVSGITQTWEYEGWAGVVSIESIRFEAGAGTTTTLRIHSTYPTVEARDQMIESGMESGMNDGFAALDALLADLMTG